MILRASHARPSRGGYTLLEVLLASMLAALVLAGVYMALNVTVQQTQVSRDAVEVEDLSRGVFNKMSLDLAGTLAPLPPKSGGNSAASGGGTASSSSSGAAASGMGGASATGAAAGTGAGSGSGSSAAAGPATGSTDPSGTGAAATDPSATDNSTAAAADYAFQGGVIGDEKKLIVFAGRVPEALGRYGDSEQVRSDQRQIIYWLGKGGTGGLYRRERPWVTADDVRTAAIDDEQATDATLLAEEVTDLQFEYSDGTGWATTWDGTAPGPDGVTPLGPPRAIRVTLSLKMTLSRGDTLEKTVTQIIAIRAAPGTYTPPLLEAPTDGGDNAAPADPGGGSGTTGANGSGGAGAPGGATGGGKAGGPPGGNAGGKGGSFGGKGGSGMGGGTGATGGPKGGTGGPKGGTGSPGGAKGGGR